VELRFLDLSPDFDRGAFDCEVESLNTFLKQYALQNQKKQESVTTVMVDTQHPRAILGYYSASMQHIEYGRLTQEQAKGLSKYRPAPAVLIGRLAVDKSVKGQGLGSQLLRHALLKAKRISVQVGCCFVLVDALEEATAFYTRYGFKPLRDEPRSLVIPVNSIH